MARPVQSTSLIPNCLRSFLITSSFPGLFSLSGFLASQFPAKISCASGGPEPLLYRDFTITRRDTFTVGLLWMNDQPVAEISAWQHTTLTTDRHTCFRRGFKPTVPPSERSPTHVIDRATIGIDLWCIYRSLIVGLVYTLVTFICC
jgi:hypothetical protein